jgi:hypothetical protein
MEMKNFNYFIEDVLPQLGFNGIFNDALKTQMQLGMKEFELKAIAKKGETEMLYALKFEKKEGDYYFLNAIKAARTDKGMDPVEQTFALFKQRGYNADEMKNMLREGGSVYRTFRKEGETVGRWTKLDLGKSNEDGNHPMRSYYDNTTGFNLAREISTLPVIHASQEEKELLIKALQSGERVPVSMKQNGQKERMFIEATPYLGRLTVYNNKMEKVAFLNNTMEVVKDQKNDLAINASIPKINGAQSVEKLPDTTKELMQKIQSSPSEGQQAKRKVS